jgi:hypothetical protein
MRLNVKNRQDPVTFSVSRINKSVCALRNNEINVATD